MIVGEYCISIGYLIIVSIGLIFSISKEGIINDSINNSVYDCYIYMLLGSVFTIF